MKLTGLTVTAKTPGVSAGIMPNEWTARGGGLHETWESDPGVPWGAP